MERATSILVVVLAVGIEPSDFVHAAAVGLLGDGANIEHGKTSAVVGLVGVVAEYISNTCLESEYIRAVSIHVEVCTYWLWSMVLRGAW